MSTSTVFDDLVQTKSNLEEWQQATEDRLKKIGYARYNQQLKGSDFQYFKTIWDNDEKIYTIGVLFYDWQKYKDKLANPEHAIRIGIQYECSFICDDNVWLSISSDKCSIEKYQEICENVYHTLKPVLPTL